MSAPNAFWRIMLSLRPARWRQIAGLVALMVLCAILEVLSIGAVVPFVSIMADPENGASRLPSWLFAVDSLSRDGLIAAVILTFLAAAVAAGGMRILLAWMLSRFHASISHELDVAVFSRTLEQPFAAHVTRNSSDALANIQRGEEVVHAFFCVLNFLSASVLSLFITATILWISPSMALLAMLLIGASYAIVMRRFNRRLSANSVLISAALSRRVRIAQEGLGGIRDVILTNSHGVFASQFSTHDRALRRAQANNAFLATAPRFFVEVSGMVVIAVFGYSLIRQQSAGQVLPILGAVAIGVQRLLPLIQQMYYCGVTLWGAGQSIRDIAAVLAMPGLPTAPSGQRLPWSQAIVLANIGFSHPGRGEPALVNVNLSIRKGAKIGIIGTTGSGKSTLLDLVMGLLEPTAGQVLIDGKALSPANAAAWRANIGHVPQAIFLSDSSLAENIAFGVEPGAIDHDRVQHAADRAQLGSFIATLPQGIATSTGERGLRLSGGQRQRVAIARALYLEPSVLVLDEATSALDHDTERAVVQAIETAGEEMTVIIVAHRMSTLRSCDEIYELTGGRLASRGTFRSVTAAQPDFVS